MFVMEKDGKTCLNAEKDDFGQLMAFQTTCLLVEIHNNLASPTIGTNTLFAKLY